MPGCPNATTTSNSFIIVKQQFNNVQDSGQQPQFQALAPQVVAQPGATPQRSSLGGSLARQSFQALKMKNATAYASTPPLSKDALRDLLKINCSRKGRQSSSTNTQNIGPQMLGSGALRQQLQHQGFTGSREMPQPYQAAPGSAANNMGQGLQLPSMSSLAAPNLMQPPMMQTLAMNQPAPSHHQHPAPQVLPAQNLPL